MGLAIAFVALRNFVHEDYGALQWCLAILAVLVAGLIVGAILNFTIFAPVYWFLGRLRFKKTERDKHVNDAKRR